jgi:hypothetical protein
LPTVRFGWLAKYSGGERTDFDLTKAAGKLLIYKKSLMNPEPKTIEEFRLALASVQKINAELKTREATFAAREAKLKQAELGAESRIADLESVCRRYKKKYGALDAKPLQQITRVDFGG